MCECEGEWLFVSICQACDKLVTCPGCTPPSPNVSWDRLQPPHNPAKDKWSLRINECIRMFKLTSFSKTAVGWWTSVCSAFGFVVLICISNYSKGACWMCCSMCCCRAELVLIKTGVTQVLIMIKRCNLEKLLFARPTCILMCSALFNSNSLEIVLSYLRSRHHWPLFSRGTVTATFSRKTF